MEEHRNPHILAEILRRKDRPEVNRFHTENSHEDQALSDTVPDECRLYIRAVDCTVMNNPRLLSPPVFGLVFCALPGIVIVVTDA